MGAANDIIFTVLREVEKEVVLVDPSPGDHPPSADVPPASDHPPTDAVQGSDLAAPSNDQGPRVLKVIKKIEVMCLCSQHNPVGAL